MRVFVTVGNKKAPFPRMVAAVTACAPLLGQDVIFQLGANTARGAPVSWDLRAFVGFTDFERLLAEADVLISHAGAGTIMQALALGLRPIVFARDPRLGEHVDPHQAELASALARGGHIYPCGTAEDLGGILRARPVLRGGPIDVRSSELIADVEKTINDWLGRAR